MTTLNSDNLHYIVRTVDSFYDHKVWDAPVGSSKYGIDYWKHDLPSNAWNRIGGPFSTEPVVCKWGPDFFVFGLDDTFTLKCKRYNGTSKAWYTIVWTTIGQTDKWLSKPGALASYPRFLQLGIIGENRVLYTVWFNGSSWTKPSGWRRNVLFHEPPVLTCWGAVREDFFTVGIDGKLYHAWWAANEGWMPKNDTGFDELGGPFFNQVQAISREPGHIDLLVVGRDRKVHHRTYNGSWKEWTTVNLPEHCQGVPDMVSFAPYRIDAFVIDMLGYVIHLIYTVDDGWSSAGRVAGPTIADRVTAVSWGPGRIDLAFLRPDSKIGHKAYTTSSDWAPEEFFESTDIGDYALSRVGSCS